ncbi:zinc finger protein OZF [Bombyx mori]|uniref:Uncharacterized protein n=1 Tax=Bombyx mori TaxID=7091 RepID=A0A8R2M4A9_BOMMO|nr:zinc finger protein OZF [Bombyx mori]
MAWHEHLISIQCCCRTCLSDIAEKTCYNIFSETEESKAIRDILLCCTSIKLKADDPLPKMLCESCYNEIMNFNVFKTCVDRVEENFQKYLETYQITLDKKTELKYDQDETNQNLYDEKFFEEHRKIQSCNTSTNVYQDKNNEHQVLMGKSKQNKDTVQFICDFCSKSFKHRYKLVDHIISHSAASNDSVDNNQNVSYSCEECEKIFKTLNSLCAHKKKHVKKGRILVCSFCKKVFKKLSHLKRHELSHRPKSYKCTDCSHTFADENRFKEHVNFHMGIKPHVCLLCKKSFRNMTGLKSHLKIHFEDHTYLCPICGKRFSSSGNLNQHVNRHTNNRSYLCENCPKKFVSKSDLKVHMKTHTGESQRRYECRECNAKFTSWSRLRTHKYQHLGIKPYKCNACTKSFPNNYSLVRHHLIHSGERPYQCDLCERAFAQKEGLNRHKRLHTSDKYHKCDQCSQTFRLKSDLQQHLSDHYNAQTQLIVRDDNVQNNGVSTDTIIPEATDRGFVIVPINSNVNE